MPLPVIVDLDVYRGDAWSQVFRLSEDGTPLDLTGSEVVSAIRHPRTDEVWPLGVELGPDVGEFTLRPPDSWPAPGHYRWDVQQTDAGGVVRTWVQGRWHLWRDVAAEVAVAAPGTLAPVSRRDVIEVAV